MKADLKATLQRRREKLWEELAEHTKPKCGGKLCGAYKPGDCCSIEYCHMALDAAKEEGVTLTPVEGGRLPLLDAEGNCVAPPYLRPLCTAHVCIIDNLGVDFEDEPWTKRYYKLRRAVSKAEWHRQTEWLDGKTP